MSAPAERADPNAASRARSELPVDPVSLWQDTVLLRAFDERAVALQRQGRIGAYPTFWGEEGIQAAAVAALRADDWLFPTYRQNAVPILRGLPPEKVLLYFRGDFQALFDPYEYGCAPQAVPVSTQLPHAVGWAWGRSRDRRGDVALAFLGDGATSEGDFHEALNIAAVVCAPVVFLCTNNQWAISTPLQRQTRQQRLADKAAAYAMPGQRVDGFDPVAVATALAEAVARARAGEGPTFIEAFCYRIGPHATADEPSRYRDGDEAARWRQREPVGRLRSWLVERELLREADADRIVSDAQQGMLEAAERLDATPPSEPAAMRAHLFAQPLRVPGGGAPSRAVPSGEATSELTLVEAVNAALHDAMAADDRVLLLGEDVGALGGVFRASDGLQQRYGDRVVDMPLAEAGTVGAAVGLCLAGFRPIVELQFETFTYPAFEQIVTHVARYCWRTAGHAGMPIVLRVPFGGGIHAPELHSDSPEALFAHMPGLLVLCPSSPQDAYELLRWAIRCPDPVVLMEPKRLYRSLRGPVERTEPPEGFPRARLVHEGSDVTLLAYGSCVETCRRAAEEFAGEASVELIDLRTLYPLDEEALLASVQHTRRCVIVHEAPRFAGVGAEVAALIAAKALYYLEAPVVRVTGLDVPFPLYANELVYLPSAARVSGAVREVLEA